MYVLKHRVSLYLLRERKLLLAYYTTHKSRSEVISRQWWRHIDSALITWTIFPLTENYTIITEQAQITYNIFLTTANYDC